MRGTMPGLAPVRYASLRVSDNGVVIPAAHVSRIFEPFFTTKEPGRGTGLGLATTFGIVRQHRGWISVASAVDVGAPTFEAPRLARVERRPRHSPWCPPSPPPRAAVARRSFVVEDDPHVRRMTCELLVRHGYQVLEARSGLEALRDLGVRAAPDRSAKLLTDVVMPDGLNGPRPRRRARLARARAPRDPDERLRRRGRQQPRDRVLAEAMPAAAATRERAPLPGWLSAARPPAPRRARRAGPAWARTR